MGGANCLQFAKDISVDPAWFRQWDHSEYGGHNSIDILSIQLPDGAVDWIVLNHILEHVADDERALSELTRILSPSGVIQITIPSPIYNFDTDDWGFPDENKIYHYREYGSDLFPRIGAIFGNLDAFSIVAIPSDPVTEVSEGVIFAAKERVTLKSVFESLRAEQIPSIRLN